MTRDPTNDEAGASMFTISMEERRAQIRQLNGKGARTLQRFRHAKVEVYFRLVPVTGLRVLTVVCVAESLTDELT